LTKVIEANYKHRIEQLQKRNDELQERITTLEKMTPKKGISSFLILLILSSL